MSFVNKVVLITGAGSGIGAATAIAFAKQSAKLSLVDIIEEELNNTIEVCKNGSEVLKIVADLTRDDEVKRIVSDTIKKFGSIDVLVNCAGIYFPAGILDDKLIDKLDKIIAVNLRSVVALTNNAVPALIESKGCVINICSILAKFTTKQNLAYSISKAAVLHFTKCAALELAEKGVRVNSVSPGVLKTKLQIRAGISESQVNAGLDFVANSTPLKKLIEPQEVADVILFLSSDNARSITGSDYEIDGGLLLSGLPSNN